MSVRLEVLLLILGCMAVTIVPRVAPMLAAHRLRLPPAAVHWLGYVPAAVISALFFKEILLVGGTLPQTPFEPHLVAGVLALAIAFASRSIGLTVIGGIAAYAMLNAWLGG